MNIIKDERGNVAVLAALCLSVIVGGAAFGVETGYWNFDQSRLQQSADAAAYAAGVEMRAGSASDVVIAAAQAAANQNGFNGSTDTLTLVTPAPGAPTADSLRVQINRTETRMLSALFTTNPMVVQAASSASFSSAGSACVLALDPTASRAAQFSGNTHVNLVGCSVMANSIASDALNVQGSATLSTPCLYTVGGVSLNGGVTLTDCDAAETGLPPVADPFRNLAYPAVSGACITPSGNNYSPGRYCGGLSFSGNKTLAPGNYIIDGGTLRINANANVSGSGVTFFLMNNATVSIAGNSRTQISAPTSGTYSGMLFMGARTNSNISVTINGDNQSLMTGAIYFPAQSVDYLGNFSGSGGCTQVVAKTVQWTGSTTVQVDCSAYGMQRIDATTVVRLIG